jgi:hypothetical protein
MQHSATPMGTRQCGGAVSDGDAVAVFALPAHPFLVLDSYHRFWALTDIAMADTDCALLFPNG